MLRIGFVSKLAPTGEVAALTDVSRTRQQSNGYGESMGPAQPFSATVGTGIDGINIGRIGG
jgi:hypothetical protein